MSGLRPDELAEPPRPGLEALADVGGLFHGRRVARDTRRQVGRDVRGARRGVPGDDRLRRVLDPWNGGPSEPPPAIGSRRHGVNEKQPLQHQASSPVAPENFFTHLSPTAGSSAEATTFPVASTWSCA